MLYKDSPKTTEAHNKCASCWRIQALVILADLAQLSGVCLALGWDAWGKLALPCSFLHRQQASLGGRPWG